MSYKTPLIFLCTLLMFSGCSKEKEDVQLSNQIPASDIDLKNFCDLWAISYSNCALNIRDSVVLFCNGDILIDSVHLYSLINDKMEYTHGLKFSHEEGGKIVVVNEILTNGIEKRLVFDENAKIKSIATNGNTTEYENGLVVGMKKGNYEVDIKGNILSVCSDSYPYTGSSPCPLWGPLEGLVHCTTGITYLSESLNINYHYYALLMHHNYYRWTAIIIPEIILNIPAKSYLYEVWKCKGGDTQSKDIKVADYEYLVTDGHILSVKNPREPNPNCPNLAFEEIKFYYKD